MKSLLNRLSTVALVLAILAIPAMAQATSGSASTSLNLTLSESITVTVSTPSVTLTQSGASLTPSSPIDVNVSWILSPTNSYSGLYILQYVNGTIFSSGVVTPAQFQLNRNGTGASGCNTVGANLTSPGAPGPFPGGFNNLFCGSGTIKTGVSGAGATGTYAGGTGPSGADHYVISVPAFSDLPGTYSGTVTFGVYAF